MTSADNVSPVSLKRQLMKLSKAQLIKRCKEHKVSYIGTKSEMSIRIINKIQTKKNKKLPKFKKKRTKSNNKKKKHKNIGNSNEDIHTHTDKQSQISQTSHSTNTSINFVESVNIFQQNIPYSTLEMRGYKHISKISPTLQGQVFIASKTLLHIDCILIYGFIRKIIHNKMNDNSKEIIQICYMYYKENIVIKSANKCYYKSSIIKTTNENIIKEAYLMSIFMNNNPPKSMIKYYDFFRDKNYYYLVMEKGEKGLFEFNVDSHKLINSGKMDLCEWRETIKHIFYEMVKFTYWLHTKLYCCHLDISLENVIISGKYNIKFIDFGLTEMFTKNNSFVCEKYNIGKLGYKAPNVFNNKPFMGNKSDIYSLGICLFLLSIGAPPYSRPIETDARFKIIKDGKIKELLKCWNRLHYIENQQLDLLMGMIQCDEMKRLSIDQVIKHKWLKTCFDNDTNKCNNNKHGRSITPSIIESNTFQCQTNDYFAAVDDIKK